MSPSYHPEPEELLEYATGAAPEWLSLMIACHLTLCPRCRRENAWLDDVGAALVESVEAGPSVAPPTRERFAQRRAPSNQPATTSSDSLLCAVPRPLHDYLPEAERRWRWAAPGVSQMMLTVKAGDYPLRLLRFRKGFVIPEHTHEGLEWLLVLDGEIGDSATGRRFGRGDVCRSEAEVVHFQDVAKDEPCIAVVANLGPLVPKSLVGRVLAKLVKI